ncbi:MAG: NAD-dependent epimerase/dehydratase family protein [Bacteroidales bacterium]|nr:NAD-dependent epimerase/dehydratase family protein [Bacteroidales bacterium]
MQTILGAGGNIGNELAKSLTKFTTDIRLVSRNPKKVNNTDQIMAADLTDPNQVDKAVEGSEVVYVTIAFDYKAKIWKETWPPLMKAVIQSCKKHKAKLVFFDNMYMYDCNHLSTMTEETPVRPTSEKGEVRRQVAAMVMDEVNNGNLTALIARAPDFISPTNSILTQSVYGNLKKGKKADWFADADKIHNFIYWVDAAKATALLGNTPDAYGQVWHLPSIKDKLTGKQWVELVAKALNDEPKIAVLPVWMMSIVGLFIPIIREFREMAYQYDRDYYFDSSKFEKRFGYQAFTAEEAIRELIRYMEKK